MELKHSYQEKMEVQLKDWGAKLDEYKLKVAQLKDYAAQLEDEAKAACNKTIKSAEERIEELHIKLEVGRADYEKLKETSEEAWGTLKTGMSQAWDDLSKGVEKAWEEMKSTIDEASGKFK